MRAESGEPWEFTFEERIGWFALLGVFTGFPAVPEIIAIPRGIELALCSLSSLGPSGVAELALGLVSPVGDPRNPPLWVPQLRFANAGVRGMEGEGSRAPCLRFADDLRGKQAFFLEKSQADCGLQGSGRIWRRPGEWRPHLGHFEHVGKFLQTFAGLPFDPSYFFSSLYHLED